MELEAKIADLAFSAKVYFLCKIFFPDFFYFSRNRDRKIKSFELNKQKWETSFELLFFQRKIPSETQGNNQEACESKNTRNV